MILISWGQVIGLLVLTGTVAFMAYVAGRSDPWERRRVHAVERARADADVREEYAGRVAVQRARGDLLARERADAYDEIQRLREDRERRIGELADATAALARVDALAGDMYATGRGATGRRILAARRGCRLFEVAVGEAVEG